ncbi:MAG: hypothetical protein LUO91_00770 [Methanomicrobiales archaeon]|nr:hypothetical protein [Methanomicrobiales archaeon]
MRTVLPSRTLPVIRWGCLVLCLILAATQGALAHAPSDIDVNFNAATRILSVTITHPVADPATHYVREVTIRQSDNVFSKSEYSSQPSPDTFTYAYPIPADVTGIIEVKAECSIGGEKTKALAISTYTPDTTPPGATTTVTTPPLVTFPPPTGSPTAAPSPAAGGIATAALGALAVLAVWLARR